MAQNSDAMSEAQIKTIVVSVDDIISAFKRNRRDADEQRTHVLRVSPPFAGEVKATPHVSEDHAHYPADMDPTPIHINPASFVGYESGNGPRHQTDIPIPTWSESRRQARDDHGDNVSEQTVEEYHEVAMDVWEERIRGNLKEEVLVARNPETGDEAWAEVQYE